MQRIAHYLTLWLLLAAAVLASGCLPGRLKPLPAETTESLAGRSLIVAVRDGAPLRAESLSGELATAATVLAFWPAAGLTSWAISSSQGAAIADEYALEDPAVQIAEPLAGRLASAWQLSRPSRAPQALDTSDLDVIAERLPEADLLLELHTYLWWIKVQRFLDNYCPSAVVEARLVSLESRHVLASGACRQSCDPSTEGLPRQELLANGAAKLKDGFAALAAECVESLAKEVFGVDALAFSEAESEAAPSHHVGPFRDPWALP